MPSLDRSQNALVELTRCETENEQLRRQLAQWEGKWAAIPWDDLKIALACSMIEEYDCSPGDDKHVDVAQTWFDANAPRRP